MCKYKPSLTKIGKFYIVALLNGTNCRFVDFKYLKVNTVLLFLSSYRQFFVSNPKGS